MAKVDQLAADKQINPLYDLIMKKNWDEVDEVYKKYPVALTATLTKFGDTGLHIAISSYRHGGKRHDKSHNQKLEGHVLRVISSLCEEGKPSLYEVLASENVEGYTPLHLAAAIGMVEICDNIAAKDSNLIRIRNRNGETPLFVAAHHGHIPTFLRLLYYCNEKNNKQEQPDSLCRRKKDGNTVLHTAISGKNFELAFQIINKFDKKLINMKNVNGETSLHFLARMSNVFNYSRQLRTYFEAIIYRFAPVEALQVQDYPPPASGNTGHSPTEDQTNTCRCPGNYRTCANLFRLLWIPFRNCINIAGKKTRNGSSSVEESQKQRHEKHQTKQEEQGSNGHFYPRNYENTVLLFKFSIKIILVVLGFGYHKIKKIREKKKWHEYAVEIMDKLIEAETQYKYEYTGKKPTYQLFVSGRIELPSAEPSNAEELEPNQPKEDHNSSAKGDLQDQSAEYENTPILEAARWGVHEMVEKILRKCSVALYDLDKDEKNLLMVAAEHRQTRVFDKLLENEMLQEYLFRQVDKEGNGILHLAARLEMGAEHWDVFGSVLQMQGEIKWYEYVKSKLPKMSFSRPNIHGDTPKKIFVDTHGWLRKEAADWMKTTSDSCSVIAALVATVGFTTSASIPGGPDQHTGYPIFKDQLMFTVFAITSFIALSLSVTALVLFLSIITSRCQEEDFKNALPLRLLMGLTSLFASIALMLASFCAGHSFVLREKVKVGPISLYVLATIPVMLFVLAQHSLSADLWRAIHSKVLQRSYKRGPPTRGQNDLSGTRTTASTNGHGAAPNNVRTFQPVPAKSTGASVQCSNP